MKLENPDIDELAQAWGSEPEPFEESHATAESRLQRIEDLPRVEDIGSAAIQWDVEDLIPSATIVLVTGDAGAGKSTFICALGYAISKGRDFLDRRTSKRPVLVLDAENPSVAVIERFRRLGIETDDDFRVWGQWIGEDAPSAGGAIVLEWIARCDPKPTIIVDSFIRFHPGAENDSTETQKYMSVYRRIAATGATVIILHHIGKAETAQHARGFLAPSPNRPAQRPSPRKHAARS
jgi:RecA-family ATPase